MADDIPRVRTPAWTYKGKLYNGSLVGLVLLLEKGDEEWLEHALPPGLYDVEITAYRIAGVSERIEPELVAEQRRSKASGRN